VAISVEALRAYGAQRVELVTRDGRFVGRLDIEALGEGSLFALLVRDGEEGEPLVVPLDAIESVSGEVG
jgi:hypothetical protein